MVRTDYIILGAGASGLMLAYRMACDSFFDDKTILLIDKVQDKGNDRTWCFWEKEEGEWDDVVSKEWDNVTFKSPWYSERLTIKPYSYKMIRSQRLYEKLWFVIKGKTNITFREEEVVGVKENGSTAEVTTKKGAYQSSKAFNSIMLDTLYKSQSQYPVLNQHFIGWFVKTTKPQFDDSAATFMDFDLPQKGNTRFMYILPTSKTEALFEYTLFSKDLLDKIEYENAIEDYLVQKGVDEYSITEKEQGCIPMTSYEFSKENSKHVLNIGTAGGWTKASTGYTFRNISKKTLDLVGFLKKEDDLTKFGKRTKFWFYDLLFLDVLANRNDQGSKLFATLFKRSKVQTIFKFLDDETHFLEDLGIMTSVPIWRFTKAWFRRLFGIKPST